MVGDRLRVFYEDGDMIVVEKPVGMEAQSARSFSPDLVSEIKKHIHNLSTSRGEPYVGVIHRLDKPVGGIMVYAKTRDAAASLSRQVREGRMQKVYMAVVCGKPVDNVKNFVDYLLKEDGGNRSRIVEKGINGAKRGELRFQVVETLEDEGLALVRIWLLTGRHHQIRVQFAGHGLPLWGDSRYNPEFMRGGRQEGGRAFPGGAASLALWACGLSFFHPRTGKPMDFEMEPEGWIFGKFFHRAD